MEEEKILRIKVRNGDNEALEKEDIKKKNLFVKKHTIEQTVTAIQNTIHSISVSHVNASTCAYVERSYEVKADAIFPYSRELDPLLNWKITYEPEEGKTIGDKEITAFINTSSAGIIEGKTRTFSASDHIFTFIPYKVGKYTLEATLNNKSTSFVFETKETKVKTWRFTNSNGWTLNKLGMNQPFTMEIEIEGGRDQDISVALFVQYQKDKTKVIPLGNHTIDSSGKMTPITIGSDHSFWNQMKELGEKSYYTISLVISRNIYPFEGQKPVKDKLALYLPQKYGDLVSPTVKFYSKTTFDGRFVDRDNYTLKRIVPYGEPVKAQIQILKGYESTTEPQREYLFSLFENKKWKDVRIADFNKKKVLFDKGKYTLEVDIPTDKLGKESHEKDKGTDHNPRLFYFQIEEEKKPLDKTMFTYPTGLAQFYNDETLITLEKHDGENNDAIDERNEKAIKGTGKNDKFDYYYQLKVAKETDLNNSLDNKAMVIIGEPLTYQKESTSASVCVCKQYDLIWGSKVNCAFRKKIVQICSELWGEDEKIKMANALMAVIAAESSRTFKSNIIEGIYTLKEKSQLKISDFWRNNDSKTSRAVGLIQFTQDALEALDQFKRGSGFDALNRVKLKFAQMDETEQLDWVKKYFMLQNAHKKITIPEDIYIHVFAPTGVGKPFDTVLYTKEKNPKEYERNKSVDKNNSGKITSEDLLIRFKDLYKEGESSKFQSLCEIKSENSSTNSNDWHDPVINPQINKYNSGGYFKPQSACFGNVRSNNGKRFHSGIDLFAIPIVTEVYACLDCEYHAVSGSILELNLINTKQLIERIEHVGYELKYDDEYLAGIAEANYKGKEANFVLNETDKIRFQYIHLDSIRPKNEIVDKNGIVKAGTHIGYAGVEGNADKTHAPHLHFGIKNITKDSNGKYFLNPALFINLHSYDNKAQDEANKQWRDKKNRSN